MIELNTVPFECETKELFENRLFDRFPEPWEVSRICPELVFNLQNVGKKFASYLKNEKLLINELIDDQFLNVRRIVFITHGFLSSKDKNWLQTLESELLNVDDCFVCTLCWGGGAQVKFNSWTEFWYSYEQSAANAIEVGKWLSKYLLELRKRFKHLNIYCVGHSLGAHLMGCAGKLANQKSGSMGKVINRITGLDPAGPGFQTDINSQHRLEESDAKFVDVIHTDGWGYGYYFGTYLTLGSIDFYPNYGFHQKQFNNNEHDVMLIPKGDLCRSHSRAIDFFIWSINNRKAFKTSSVLLDRPEVESITYETRKSQFCLQMGYHADKYLDKIELLRDRWFYVGIKSQIPRF